MAEIILDSISHSYVDPPEYVLRDVELRWRDGGAYALLGPSGCGKTTLLNIISGLIRPSRGRVRYDGEDVTGRPTRQRNIAQVFQFPVIYDTMTVFQNLAFPLENRGVSRRDINKRVRHIAEMLELTDVLGHRATNLSADMKQIISLGRGLVRDDVAAILFDEPLTVIDPQRKWLLRRKLREIHRQFQHTLIYVTHDQTEALTFADEVVVLYEGEVLQQAAPEELFLRPAHPFVGYFIGSPGMNFFACEVVDGAAVIAGHAVPLPAEVARRASADHSRSGDGPGPDSDGDSAFELGIRPEHIALADSDDPGLPVAIDHVEHHGRFSIVSGAIGEQRVKVKLGADTALAAGARCHIRFPAERVCLYRHKRLIADTGAAAGGGA